MGEATGHATLIRTRSSLSPMRGVVVMVFLLSMLFAGCTDPSDGSGGGGSDPAGSASFPVADPVTLFPIDNSGTGCREGFVAAAISMDQAGRHLPPGFTAGDASELFGFPAGTTMGAAIFTVFHCAASAYGNGTADAAVNTTLMASDLGVVIEAPDIPGVEPVASNFYVVRSWTNNTRLVEAFGAAQVNFSTVAPSLIFVPVPVGGGYLVGADVNNETGIIAEWRIEGLVPNTFTTTGRFWQQTPTGILFADYTLDGVPIRLGNVECSIDEASPHAEILGAAECPKSTVGIVLVDVEWTSQYVFLPGASAAA